MYYLFVIMTFMDGTIVNYKYKQPVEYFQCMQNAKIEAAQMKPDPEMKAVEYYCGRNEDFIKQRLLEQ